MSFADSNSLASCLSRMAGKTVLITGGAGFIGSHLTDYLLDSGVGQVIIVDDLLRARVDWLRLSEEKPRVRCIRRSILEITPSDLAGVDVVYHLAAISRVMDAARDPERTFAVNTTATVRLASAAQQAAVRRLVFSSSREVYGDPETLPVREEMPIKPKNVYGASKAAAEMFLSTLRPPELEAVIVRLANVYGPGDTGRVIPSFFNNALNGQPLVLYGGKQVLDLIWIGDVVKALIKAGFSESPVPEPTNIGSGKGTPLPELAQHIADLVGSHVPVQIAPARSVEVERYEADLTRAERYYGLTPQADPLVHLPEVLAALNEHSVR